MGVLVTRSPRRHRPVTLIVASVTLVLGLAWVAAGRFDRTWPIRNLLEDDLRHLIATIATIAIPPAERSLGSQPAARTPGATVVGTIRATTGRVVPDAMVLIALPDGDTREATTDAEGSYRITDVPRGRRPLWVGAGGYDATTITGTTDPLDLVRAWFDPGIAVLAEVTTVPDIILRPTTPPPPISPDEARFVTGESISLTCERPVVATAARSVVTIPGVPVPDGQILRYRPDPDATDTPPDRGPLVVVYPGPAPSWECASMPLAMMGFDVVAYGPPYGFDVEREVRLIRGLIQAIGREHQSPGVAVLAGSYSAIHALRAVQDSAPRTVRAVVLMGPPVDLFDLRLRLERGNYRPPFGLDRALVAIGRPDRAIDRHARYSARLHVRPDHPPTLIIHSRADEVVPYPQGEAYLTRLTQAGVRVEAMILDGGGHYLLSDGDDASAILIQTVRFLANLA